MTATMPRSPGRPPSETMPRSIAMTVTMSQNDFVRLPAAGKASGRRRTQSMNAYTSTPRATTERSSRRMRRSAILRDIVATCSGPSSWLTPTRATRPGRVSSPTTSPSTVTEARVTRWRTALTGGAPRSRRDPDGDDPADRRPVAEDRGLLEPLVGIGHDPEVAEDGGEQHGAGPLGTVRDLEGDPATVRQADGVDAFGAVLGDEALGSPDEGGDVPARTAQVLRVRADGGGDLRLGCSRLGGRAPPQSAGPTREREWHDRGATTLPR